jgi:hypothetical protein
MPDQPLPPLLLLLLLLLLNWLSLLTGGSAILNGIQNGMHLPADNMLD